MVSEHPADHLEDRHQGRHLLTWAWVGLASSGPGTLLRLPWGPGSRWSKEEIEWVQMIKPPVPEKKGISEVPL